MFNDYGTQIYKSGQFNPVTIVFDNGEEFFLPNTLVDIELANNIESTKIPGRDGTVNELIGSEDVIINVSGTYNNRDEVFPFEALQTIRKLWMNKSAIEIINPVTDYFLEDDQKVIIKAMNIPNLEGVNSVQRYSIQFKSDIISELYV